MTSRFLRWSGRPLAVLALGLGFPACGDSPEEAPVEETAPEPPPPEPEPPAPPPATPPVREIPRFGSLHVEGTEGASAILDNEPLGTLPGRWESLEPGEYDLRVQLENHHPFETRLTIEPGKTRVVTAVLSERLGSLVVESDQAGAMVFVDRNFKGNTPVTVADLQPGEYALTVSLEGYEVESRRVVVEREPVPVRIEFGDLAPTLDAAVPVVHKHAFGSCRGTLTASPEGFRYQTDHRDAFTLSFEAAETFELDYLNNNLRLKVRGGRTYNFESPTEDMDSLFVFHRDVLAFREKIDASR